MYCNNRSARGLTKAVKNLRLPSGLTAEAVLRFYEALDCSKSLMAAILFRNKEYEQLFDLSCDPSQFNSPEMFRDAYLACNFLSKSRFLRTSIDRSKAAISKFLSFEEQCGKTNSFFSRGFVRGYETLEHSHLFTKMKSQISSILGKFCPEELFDLASWGPGVSTLIKGDETFAAKKFQYDVGITQDLYPLAKDLLPLAYPGWWSIMNDGGPFHFEVGNHVVTVPKTSKIDRVIAIEPGINSWFQLGLGRMISRRLARRGIDLSDQTKNQYAAYLGSKYSDLATVDFSSASDSISSGLIERLFERDRFVEHDNLPLWFSVMDSCRSHYGIIDGNRFKWNKFSSMGNGFTFPLETLIFYAAAVVCCRHLQLSISDVRVYGDDVIIPVSAYKLFSSFSEYLGFTVNPKKSFSEGLFRESCGSHYFSGVSCKPLYLEDALVSFQEVSNFANTLRIRSHDPNLGYCDSRFRSLFYWLKKQVPKFLRFPVSAVYNAKSHEVEPTQGGFISNFDEACPVRAKHGLEGYVVPRIAWIAVKLEVEYPGLLQARLSRFARDKAEGNFCPLRGRTKVSFNQEVLVRRWYDLGPWI